jgi:hypothetical protein
VLVEQGLRKSFSLADSAGFTVYGKATADTRKPVRVSHLASGNGSELLGRYAGRCAHGGFEANMDGLTAEQGKYVKNSRTD